MWLEKPLTDRCILEKRLSAVEVLSNSWSVRQALRKSLDKIYDLERLTTRILYRRAIPREMISMKNSLGEIPHIKNMLAELNGSQYIKKLIYEIDNLDEIKQLLEDAIDDNAPQNLNSGGVIKTSFNAEIDKLRSVGENGRKWISQLESQEKEKTGIKSLKVGFNKVFGYYFEVTKANLTLVPEYFQRKQTLANGERYITEELIDLENQVLGAEEKLLSLEAEIYNGLLEQIGENTQRIQKTTRILAQLDVLQSMAELAVKNCYVRPVLKDGQENLLIFKDLRHPVVEKLVSNNNFVPNDIQITEDIILGIITGPNMGGKSTFCRSVALAVIMAQAGSFVPAKAAEISLRDRVFARVGANDDLGSGQSTFMVEMNEVANILRYATPHSLVILDEVGRGTSTYDGLSMAWAVSEYLVKELQAKTLFATHYHELTQLEELIPGIQNLSVAAREKGEEIIFLHKIVVGPADKSYGIQVGRLAGLPLEVIGRAREILRSMEAKKEENLNISLETSSTVKEIKQEYIGSPAEDCIKELLALDLHSITPLEALNRLHQLKQIVKKT
jgi:DNA mismatch repair protein MutS